MKPLMIFAVALALAGASAQAVPVGSAFTFQGQLKENGAPAEGPHNLVFRLFDEQNTQFGGAIVMNGHPVENGLFSVELDFGPGVFNGDKRELEIEVDGIVLTPRQPIHAVPYAMYALDGPGATGGWSTNGANIHNANAGNVGIGITTPLTELHVRGSNATLRLEDMDIPGGYTLLEDPQPTQLRVSKTNLNGQVLFDLNPKPADGTSAADIRFFRETNTTGPKSVRFLRGTNSTALSAVIGVDGADSLFQLHGGNVGIGTPSPIAKLQVIGGAGSSAAIAGDGYWGVSGTANSSAGYGGVFGGSGFLGLGNALFVLGDSHLSGNVGIGNANPSAKLHVTGGTNAAHPGGGYVVIGNIAGQNIAIDDNEILARSNESVNTLLLNNDGGDVRIGQHAGSSTLFVNQFETSGRVGIGGPPTSINYGAGPLFRPLLTVHGDIRVENVPVWDGPDGNDLTWGAGSSGGVNFNPDKLLISREGSSRRYKTNIRRMDEDFAKILRMEPKTYQMRPGYGPPDAWNFGYIAEELEEAGLREFVIHDDEGRPDGVQYKKVALYVNEVVKSHQRMIEQLQAEIAVLHAHVQELSDNCDSAPFDRR